MIDTTQQQEVEELEYLAGLECDRCAGEGSYNTMGTGIEPHKEEDPDCQGTGRRFPGLSRECFCWKCTPVGADRVGRHPVRVPHGFLWLVGQEGFEFVYAKWVDRHDVFVGGWDKRKEEGSTAPLALFAAAKAAVEVSNA